jgi:HlyD family secretion protein
MKISTRNVFLALSTLALVGIGVFVWRQTAGPTFEERYKLQEASQGDVAQSVSANGTLNPVTLVNVGTQVSGTVKKLYVDFNDAVKAGQVLAELDDSLLQAASKQSQASIASAIATLDLAKASETRMKSLFAQEYVSHQELDQAVQARRAAEAQLKLARGQNERDRANLGYSVIRSPVSGVVVDRQIDVGQTVAASFQTPVLFKIAQDLARMQIYTSFAEADIGNIRVGQAVRFNVDAFPNRHFKGAVKQIRLNPTTTQNVVTYNVVVEVDNPDLTLLPGMTAYVNIVVAKKEGALLVPNAALRYKPADAGGDKSKEKDRGARGNGEKGERPGGDAGGGPRGKRRDAASGTVYVAEDGKLKAVSVQLGITDNRNTEILAGELKAGDRIVVGENLANGDAAANNSTLKMRMF